MSSVFYELVLPCILQLTATNCRVYALSSDFVAGLCLFIRLKTEFAYAYTLVVLGLWLDYSFVLLTWVKLSRTQA